MSINDARTHIDAVDDQILELLRQRGEIAAKIGHHKAESGHALYDPAREAQILRRLVQADLGPLEPQAVEAIYREIISACRRIEAPVRVAYLGPEHSFSHIAALQRFGHGVELLPANSITDVFHSVETGNTDHGVVPIENSTGGVVPETMDALIQTSLHITGEMYVPVHLFLMANCDISAVKRVYSHPQPLAQSRGWLHENMPTVEIMETSSTTAAAVTAAQEPGAAAIGTRSAAEAYGLAVLFANVQTSSTNRTRFLIIGTNEVPRSGHDKTSVVFSTAHRSGALHAALEPLAAQEINLTFIQSRPAYGILWEYVFYVDVEGHQTDEPLKAALAELARHCPLLKVLGSYPTAEEA